MPLADVRFFDTGHFALETHDGENEKVIGNFLDATISKAAQSCQRNPMMLSTFCSIPGAITACRGAVRMHRVECELQQNVHQGRNTCLNQSGWMFSSSAAEPGASFWLGTWPNQG